jgi:hypothetical protein
LTPSSSLMSDSARASYMISMPSLRAGLVQRLDEARTAADGFHREAAPELEPPSILKA